MHSSVMPPPPNLSSSSNHTQHHPHGPFHSPGNGESTNFPEVRPRSLSMDHKLHSGHNDKYHCGVTLPGLVQGDPSSHSGMTQPSDVMVQPMSQLSDASDLAHGHNDSRIRRYSLSDSKSIPVCRQSPISVPEPLRSKTFISVMF